MEIEMIEMETRQIATQAGPGLEPEYISWHDGKRKGRCRLDSNTIVDLQLLEGYSVSPTLADVNRLAMDIGSSLFSSFGKGKRHVSGSFKFESPGT